MYANQFLNDQIVYNRSTINQLVLKISMKAYEELLYGKKPVPKKRQLPTLDNHTKYETIKKHHKFLRQSSSQSESQPQNKQKKPTDKSKLTKQQKQKQLSKQYYDSLYKQYAIVDLSMYETGQIGCRWRTEKQVIKSKGQKICAALKCNQKSTNVYEMNFAYHEQGTKKNALVKVSVCKTCAIKLNHTKKLKQVKVKIQEP